MCLWILPPLPLQSPQTLFSGNTSTVPSVILYQKIVPSLSCFGKQRRWQGPPVKVGKHWAQAVVCRVIAVCDLGMDGLATRSLSFLIYKMRVLFLLCTIIATLELINVK